MPPRAIECITTGKQFDKILDALSYAHLKTSTPIINVCKGKRQTAGYILNEDGEEVRLTWRYIDDK